MSKNLTVILPVHNAETTLRRDVTRVLEIAGDLTPVVRLFIVDDGSTDDTYDLAIELSTRYPQVRVVRHAQRQGLMQALASLRSVVADDLVFVHDGCSPIDANQISQLWLEDQRRNTAATDRASAGDELRRAAAAHATMAAAHARLAGFQRLSTVVTGEPQLSRRDKQRKSGVGVIPPLPRPNYMGALANFALGE